MLGAKTNKRDAEEIKRFLLKSGRLDFRYLVKEEEDNLIFPISKETNHEKIEIINTSFEKKKQQKSWAEIITAKLNKKELALLKTAHDVVGTIAILEIPKELERREKLIAKALLRTKKNIKTVLKKVGEHEGTFRTQKMVWLAGKKTKETVHKENGVWLKINVEKVYFSARLSTERKRIMRQIKIGENILVMFSGAAPYLVVFSKNTKANSITGIEINEKAHFLGEKNVIMNKAGNVNLIQGNVREVLPDLYSYILGLKSNIKDEAMKSRLSNKPRIYELYTTEQDILERKTLEKKIVILKKNGVEEIFLHMAHVERETELELDEKKIKKIVFRFMDIIKKNKVNAIIHPSNRKKDGSELIKTLKNIRRRYKKEFEENTYFENLTYPSIFSDEKGIMDLAKKTGITNVCVDIAHHFLTQKSNEKLDLFIRNMKSNFRTYFHINGFSKEFGEGTEIDRGDIDIDKILPLINKGIVEVKSRDELKGVEMKRSHDLLKKRKITFDRICMPLPKSAEDFLDSALSVSKNGTIIHFYDFLHESEFGKCEEKIRKACKKANVTYDVLDFVRCGQYSPRKFRVCLDFKVRAL